jgi:hypothetical protein
VDGLGEHLEAAADAEQRLAGRRVPDDRVGQAGLAQPAAIVAVAG